MNFHTTLIASAVAAALGFTTAWQYQAHQIDKINLASEAAYSKAQAAVIEKDKRYAELQSQLSVAISQQLQTTAQTTASTATIVRSNGLFVHTASCPRLPAPPASASAASDGAAEVRLSDADAEKLRSEAQRADEAADYAGAGFEYARLIEEFIRENGK